MSHKSGGGMLAAILKLFLVIVVVGLVALWLLTGGVQKAWDVSKGFFNPVSFILGASSSTGAFFTLPWQPQVNLAPDISQYTGASAQGRAGSAPYGSGNAATFGSTSPYSGEISISSYHTSSNAAQEYLVITSSASEPISIAGWTLQSVVTEAQAAMPEAAPIFIGGVINSVAPVTLAPGGSAIIVTGPSPVGVSFMENECSGYLGRYQNFTPALFNSCPAPSSALPETAQNLQTYGASCFDFLSSLDSCATPGGNLPATLSPACRTFIAGTMTYNGCVGLHRIDASFARPTWRLYLGLAGHIWNTSHDIIRLLDSQSRVVDVLTY